MTTHYKDKLQNGVLGCNKRGIGDMNCENILETIKKADSSTIEFSLEEDIHEVEKLADIDNSSKEKGENVLEKITKLRQERYEYFLSNFYKQLEEFGLEFKNNLKTACCILDHSLKENNERIKVLVSSLSRMKTVHEEEVLIQAWNDLKYEFSQQCFHAKAFCTSVREQENLRSSMLQNLLRETFINLILSRHSTVKNIQHELFVTAMKLDHAVLMNKRQLASFSLCLFASIHRKQNEIFFQWKHLWYSWWEKTEEAAIEQFKFSINTLLVDDNFGNEDEIKKFIVEKDYVILQRITSLYFLRNLKPPHCTVESVNSWFQELIKLSNDHAQLIENFKNLSAPGKNYLFIKFEDIVKNIKVSLIARNICTKITAETFIQNFNNMIEECEFHIDKIIDDKKRSSEAEKDGLDAVEEMSVDLLKKVVTLWENHQRQLDTLAEIIQIKLDKEARRSEIICEEKELKLSAVLDELAEESEKEKMEKSVFEALEILDDILKTYERLQKCQIQIVNLYPGEVNQQLQEYSQNLKGYLDPILINILLEENSDEDDEDNNNASEIEDQIIGSYLPEWNLDVLVLKPHLTGTHSATSFREKYTMRKQSNNLNKVLSENFLWLGSEPRLHHIQRIICLNFAIHLNHWTAATLDSVSKVIEAKLSEINNEFKVKTELHSSRVRRIMQLFNGKVSEFQLLHNNMITSVREIQDMLKQLENIMKDFKKDFEHLQQKIESEVNIAIQDIFLQHSNERLEKKKSEIFHNIKKSVDSVTTLGEKSFMEAQQLISRIKILHKKKEKDLKNEYFKIPENQKIQEEFNKTINVLVNIETDLTMQLQEAQSTFQQDVVSWKTLIDNRCKNVAEENDFVKKINNIFTHSQLQIKIEVKGYNSEAVNAMAELRKFDLSLDHLLNKKNDFLEDIRILLDEFKMISNKVVTKADSLGILKTSIAESLEKKKKNVIESGDFNDKNRATPAQKDKKIQIISSTSKLIVANEIFGNQSEPNSQLEKNVGKILLETLKEMLNAAENFYGDNDKRTINFSKQISATIEEFKSQTSSKLKNIWIQIQDHIIQLTSEFVEYKKTYDCLTKKLIQSFTTVVLSYYLQCLNDLKESFKIEIHTFKEYWEKILHHFMLRLKPFLGKPTAEREMDVYKKEVNNALEAECLELNAVCKNAQADIQSLGEKFIDDINYVTKSLLIDLDEILNNDDITVAVTEEESAIKDEGEYLSEYSDVENLNLNEDLRNKDSPIYELGMNSRRNAYRCYLKNSSDLLKWITEIEISCHFELESWKTKWIQAQIKLKEALLPY